jgi:hypothetical protein
MFMAWQFPQLLEQAATVALDDGDVMGAVFAQPVAVGLLGVGGVRGDHSVLQRKAVQERDERGRLVTLRVDLALGDHHPGMIHRSQQPHCPLVTRP